MQAVEVSPRTDREGPCLIILHEVPSTHRRFIDWFTRQDWLRRSTARICFLPVDDVSQHAVGIEQLVQKLVTTGVPQCPLRLQVCPRKSEMAIAVRIACACIAARGACVLITGMSVGSTWSKDATVEHEHNVIVDSSTQDALEIAGFHLNPRQGGFDAVLAVVQVGKDTWRFGYSPASLMWKNVTRPARTHSDLCSSACNKLDEALQTCGLHAGNLDVRSAGNHDVREVCWMPCARQSNM